MNYARDESIERLARRFARTGRVGLWIQVGIGAISLAMLVFAFFLNRSAGMNTRGAMALIQYLTLVSLAILFFTAIWSYRYTLVGRDLSAGDVSFDPTKLVHIVWIGVAASVVGLVVSMMIILFESTQLFVYFLRAPQAGVPVVQTDGSATWVSAGDILSLTVTILAAFAEVIVFALGLRLLFYTTRYSCV